MLRAVGVRVRLRPALLLWFGPASDTDKPVGRSGSFMKLLFMELKDMTYSSGPSVRLRVESIFWRTFSRPLL